MNILLINQNSALNIGDFAIHRETIRLVEQAFPGARLVLTYHDRARAQQHLPGYTILEPIEAWAYQVGAQGQILFSPPVGRLFALAALAVAVLVYRLRGSAPRVFRDPEKQALLVAYTSADLVLASGGGYIYDTAVAASPLARLITFVMWSCFLLGGNLLAIALNKPLVLLPQSIGPLHEPLQRRLVAWMIRRARFTFVRERESLALLDALGCGSKAVYAPDMAFGMAGAEPGSARAILDAAGLERLEPAYCVGVTAIDWRGQSQAFAPQAAYEQALVECIDQLTAEGAVVVLFAQCHSLMPAWDDRLVNQRLHASVRQPERVLMINQVIMPELLQALYGQMDYFIGTRMHSVILATNAGVPALAIGYLYKSIGIMRELGLAQRCFDIATVTSEQLLAGVAELRRQPERETIERYVAQSRRFKRALRVLLPLMK